MDFYDFSKKLEEITKIKKRNEIVNQLNKIFLDLNYDLIPLFIELSLGKFEDFTKRDINVGISTFYDALKDVFLNNFPKEVDVEDFGEFVNEVFKYNKKFEPSNYTIVDIYNIIKSFVDIKGSGAKKIRVEKLSIVLKNLSNLEAKYFAKIVVKEIRGGIKEGLFKKAISIYFKKSIDEIEEIFIKSGSFRKLFENFKKGEFEIKPLKPIPMMLAEKIDNFDDIYREMKENFIVEYKYDGVRVQIHKKFDQLKIFSRNLNDITIYLGDFLDKIRKKLINIDEIILEGELVGFDEKENLLPFQDLMKIIFKKEKEKKINLDIFLFDILYLNGKSLINLPYKERIKVLEEVRGSLKRVKYLFPKNLDEIKDFFTSSLKEGNEGVMIKNLESEYISGKRGRLWLKLKKVYTLDLVILKAFWGYGRRKNFLSDYMLYCITKDKKNFLPLGKTFKGLTDEEFNFMTENLMKLKINDIEGGIEVLPKIVVEVGFDDIQFSNKYESGFALRFARIVRIREDKSIYDINTIEDVKEIYNSIKIKKPN